MATRIRTLNFLPEIFKTPTNAQFLSASLDQIVDQPNTMKVEGYIGSKFGYGINPKDYYVVEPTKTRTDYQLEPGVVFTNNNETTANDFLSYPGLLDAIKLQGGLIENNDRLFTSQIYSWDSFCDLDKIINFNQYYWLPFGPTAVVVSQSTVYNNEDYFVISETNDYQITTDVANPSQINPTLTLLRGGTYTFNVNQSSSFWIQGAPGVTGYSPTQSNLYTRDILGVDNNGISTGTITFTVPQKDAQSEYNLPGNNVVDLVSTLTYSQVNGATLNDIGGSIDGVTNINGLTLMFYNNQNQTSFYTITTTGSLSNPTINLTVSSAIPSNELITVNYGIEYTNKSFYLSSLGLITEIPYQSAILDTLYYQDGSNPNKVGIIRIIENNETNTINVVTDILGKKNYTASNGVTFTNGLKVTFQGDVVPTSYLSGEYYVEGVGTSIQLLPANELIAPEPFTQDIYIPYDTTNYDIGNYDSNLYIPVLQDYITIARNSINKNAWSRSNRWFHIDVIKASAEYNNDPAIVTRLATTNNKAKRPIIEFYPNLALFDSGTIGKAPVDYVDFRTTDAFNQVAGQQQYYPDIEVYSSYPGTAVIASVTGTSTTITVPVTDVTGKFQVGQYIVDNTLQLPTNTQVTNVVESTTTYTLTVSWENTTTIAGTSAAILSASDTPVDNYALYNGFRIVFANDKNLEVRNKIYVVQLSTVNPSQPPVITLFEADDGNILANDQTVAFRGYYNQGKDFYFDGGKWLTAQQKTNVNQPPLFDVYDKNGISFGDKVVYQGSSFKGSKLFAYAIGSGINDVVLNFPIKYSSIDNVGDISFDVSFNTDTFDYVSGTDPVTQLVNTGYVHNTITRNDYTRKLGWETSVAPSTQYQLFQINYVAGSDTTFVCDVPALTDTTWPNIQVYVDNVYQSNGKYSVLISDTETTIILNTAPTVDSVIEILILSNSVSKQAYYTVPVNLSNNPFNQNLSQVDVGDIRLQYQSIYYNNPNFVGQMFGANNYRDLGNLVPWGNSIIQNSASLVLPSVFLRKQNHNLFDALQFNSRAYITFKALLVDTVNNTEYSVYQTPASILDDALEQMTMSKTNVEPFFWSDMLPSKAPYISNSYTFAANALQQTVYPLANNIDYDFTKANYNGVLVYLTRKINNFNQSIQLINGLDYTIDTETKLVTVTKQLELGDVITINQYNQTFGSYVPNTPTKLGMYPATIPTVILDTNYVTPTYFIVGHDGSYNKLYGAYEPETGRLVDFRDQALLEFEKRIYNNLKLSGNIPLTQYDVIPGFFRDTGYTSDEILQIYSESFLNWVGQNRVNYQTQFFNSTNPYTFNYWQSANKINKEPIQQGNWRGIYQYFYDTASPNTTPWEMIGYSNQPSWWEDRYGPAPYTSDNLVLWTELANGIDYNNGIPVVKPEFVRPQLLQILPVDNQGKLLPPFVSVMGNYTSTTFQRNWKVGDSGPAEFSYRKSSSWPFDLVRILALTKPAEFFNLYVDLDNYKYSAEFNQYLVNDRSHLVPSDIEIYGNGIAKTSYINWIVDYEKQAGIDATSNIKTLLNNLDVRLVYRLAGFSDKQMLRFYVEKSTPSTKNASLLIPEESYSVLLYENQPFDKIIYSSVVVQITQNGFSVYGNSQDKAYFKTLKPVVNGNYDTIEVEGLKVKIAKDYIDEIALVPYGYQFYTVQEVSQFLVSYGKYLESQGMIFADNQNGIEVTWAQMVAEYLYWVQMGWEVGSITTLNPAATLLSIDKDSHIVQPLYINKNNFVLNQNLYPIQSKDLAIIREGTSFNIQPMNQGDALSYGQFNVSNFEHGIVFNNVTQFNDVIYNLVTGLRQNRIYLRGTKSAEWNGTVDAQGFILNQDNIVEWNPTVKYTTGSIVKYKNKYYTALKVIQPKETFQESDWKRTNYDEIQKGLLPNSSTNSYEMTLYYDTNQANLQNDADLLSFSLIGFRPRDYMSYADLTDITQVNVYQNLIKNKGTRNAVNAFKGATLSQGGIEYDVYENWAIKSGEFGGVLNTNFVELQLNEPNLVGNPSTVALTDGQFTGDAEQSVSIYSLFNYGRNVTTPYILSTVPTNTPNRVFPDAGYVNFNDVKLASFYYSGLPTAVDSTGKVIPLNELYVRDYVWLANYLGTWQVYTPISLGQVLYVKNNLNNTATVTFENPHGLSQYQLFSITNFNDQINGYYITALIVDPYNVIINLNLDPNIRNVTGQGIGFKFQSHRVSQPSDVNTLPLIDSEFVKNKVWVDTNTDGSWAVYRKGINYQYTQEINQSVSQQFGSSVAYNPDLGYLIGDSGLGKVYRYTFNAITNQYQVYDVISKDPSFGTTIAHNQSIFAISEPTGNKLVHVYKLVINNLIDSLVPVQSAISAPVGVTSWGDSLAISGDSKWLYISAKNENTVYVYRLNQTTNQYAYATSITVAGLTSGDNFGTSIATDYYGDTVIIGAPNKDYNVNVDNYGYSYVFDRSSQNFIVPNNSLTNTFALAWTPNPIDPIYVTVNGTLVSDTNYSIVDNTIVYTGTLVAGDIVNISGQEFTLTQTLTTEATPRIGVQFGISVDTTTYASEIIVGAPFELNEKNVEGAVYRYTNAGAKYGIVTGVSECLVTTPRTILINGYSVTVPIGAASTVANAINSTNIINVIASSTTDNKLIIQLIDTALATPNNKLDITSTDVNALGELGIKVYVKTQTINCPHTYGPTQFGRNVKFNEYGSFVASAPTGTRYEATTFDFTDDELDNDTVFDNNSTQFIDTTPNVGAVYMFDYLANYNESLSNTGKFVYAQSVNNENVAFGSQPMYGHSLDFNSYRVIVGTPKFVENNYNGQVIVYENNLGVQDWSIYRQSSPVVDIDRVENIQLFSASTNNTLENLDYIDPLQGKILGAARENIDIISNVDPAGYNVATTVTTQKPLVWGANKVGSIWLDTSSMRYFNYHQNDNKYNAKYWGQLFPGSQPIVYSWVTSNVTPDIYQGPGVPYDITKYTTEYVINANQELTPVYFFWARNTNVIFTKAGKTLADSIIESYVLNPQLSGISYFAPLSTNLFGLYNCQEYINANDTVLHVGYSTGTNNDVAHTQYTLIRENYADDFLPGLPGTESINAPQYLYDRLLDSLCGVDEIGNTVPDPYLPLSVQTGILARPRQSFFLDRFAALKNYIQYANEVVKQYPIVELKNLTFLNKVGPINPSNGLPFYDTTQYWQYINWWANGYSNNTKPAVQVQYYADLATLTVKVGTIVRVSQNDSGNAETYRYEIDGSWTRIGLENGTIEFSSTLYDYAESRIGFGDNFFDTTPYDSYPSQETKYVVRALNEEIYTNELLIHRNKSLILLFEYIQAESLEKQNYLPWLNKTSLVDVSHTIRELVPLEVYRSDNQEFLSGYLNEVKPYHVVIKDFVFKYTGTDTFAGDITDFDLPAQYNSSIEQFITPVLVQENPSADNEYLPTDPLWQEPNYSQWYNNYGLSLVGQNDYPITTLTTYIALNTNSCVVNNASGFPVNGTIRIGQEIIGYSGVDRNLNVLSGLVRGVNGTTVSNHIPGQQVYIDLPPVIVLDSGRGYINPPKVTAYIDTSMYPTPRTNAVLEAIMAGDKVASINVINPGDGYVVMPEIIIDSSITATFSSSQVNVLSDTVELFFPLIQTGDLIQYNVGENTTKIGGLIVGQWYYVNVLETNPTTIVGLYSSYIDAIRDNNRIKLYTAGSGSNHSLNVGAKASCITSSAPIRENIVTLRYDRTTYNSEIIDWEAGKFYGSFFAGTYNNSANVSSSSITLQNVNPPINSILASSQGVSLEIVNVEKTETISWSSLTRKIVQTYSIDNSVRLVPNNSQDNASESTIGFYAGMPIKFTGFVGNSNIVIDTVYYVDTVLSDSTFTISATKLGPVFALNDYVVPESGCTMSVGQISSTTKLDVTYPGITKVTATTAGTNALTIPLNVTGTGGTNGFYTGLPIFYTGTMIGGVIQNQNYYVTTVIDNQTFTMSKIQEPLSLQVSKVNASTNAITLNSNFGLSINDPIIFNEMYINVGYMIVGQEYVIKTIGTTDYTVFGASSNTVGLKFTANGTGIVTAGSFVIGKEYTINSVGTTDFTLIGASTNQAGVTFTATGTGSGTGTAIQGNGTVIDAAFYPSFGGIISGTVYYVNSINNTNSTDITISQTINGPVFDITNTVEGYALLTSQTDVVQLTTDSGNDMTINISLPVSPGQVNGQLFTLYDTSKQYPNLTGTNSAFISSKVEATLANVNRVALKELSSDVYVNMPVKVDTSIGGLIAGTQYYVMETGNIQITVTQTSSATNELTCDSTDSLYEGMLIQFAGNTLGGITPNSPYFVKNITSNNKFTLSLSPTGTVISLINATGTMNGVGKPYVVLTTDVPSSVIPAPVTLSRVVPSTTISMTQNIVRPANFDVSYVLGGYQALISDPGIGYAINNTITILGNVLDGLDPKNNLTLVVNSVNDVGSITSVICNGTPAGYTQQYYLKVTGSNQMEVFNNQKMTVPANPNLFTFTGITQTVVSSVVSNQITVSDISGFNVDDPVVFTGFKGVKGDITVGVTYYIQDIIGNAVTLTTDPGNTTTVIVTSDLVGSTMAKAGDYALLPEPFYFNQSIVKYNNNVYTCLISNNDKEFVYGKWELLQSDDRRLNALDRIAGYYQPTIDMPGLDPSQLVSGISYPNSQYVGNPFAPEYQFQLDTILQDRPFYLTNVNTVAIVYDGVKFVGVSNTDTNSIVVTSANTEIWDNTSLAQNIINPTDIIYQNGKYIVTCFNTPTPILTSTDSVIWNATNYIYLYGQEQQAYPFITAPVDISNGLLKLNAITYANSLFVAVGNSIITSDTGITWNQPYVFSNDTNIFNGIKYVEILGFNGFIAVGAGTQATTALDPIVNTNLITISSDANTWADIPSLSDLGFNSIDNNNNIAVTVGDSGVMYYTQNGSDWFGLSETIVIGVNGTNDQINVTSTAGLTNGDRIRFTQSFNNIDANTTYRVTVLGANTIKISTEADYPSIFVDLSDVNPTVNTYAYLYPRTSNLNKILYKNDMFMVVGDNGVIMTSTDGFKYTVQPSGVTVDLHGIAYNDSDNTWVVSGNDIILISNDNGASWSQSYKFTVDPVTYDVQGDAFTAGYGPEELVPGVVSDNLTMIVTTRPGTNWDPEIYQNVGYEVVAVELAPTSGTQTVYSFKDAVKVPQQVRVSVINGVTNLATTLIGPNTDGVIPDYSIDWINETVTLNSPLPYIPVANKLLIEVYETGNGDQLVKSNTQITPIRFNESTGYSEIYVDCNYSQPLYKGSGVIKFNSSPTEVLITEASSLSNTFTCDDVTKFTVNQIITFQGAVFGGVSTDTVYYVKTISYTTKKITISATQSLGVAGPTLDLVDGTGSMYAIANTGPSETYTAPYIMYNGNRLVQGNIRTVTHSNGITNTITCNNTNGFNLNDRVVFSDTMFNSGLVSGKVYYINNIVDNNEFTVSETIGGPTVTLNTATGGCSLITNDYSFGLQENGFNAKIVLSGKVESGFMVPYNEDTDYIAFTLLGETYPVQYGYTLPQTQYFVGDGNVTYTMTNYNGGTNPTNAIVEVNGLRLGNTNYTISDPNNTITFTSAPVGTVSITTYNFTDRQYFNTQYNITGKTVAPIVTINNNITAPIAETVASATTSGTNVITVSSTSNFVIGQTVYFKGTMFGGITAGTIYYVKTITPFTISTMPDLSNTVTLTNGSGSMLVIVGGQPAVRVTTSIANNLSTNDIVRLDGITGSYQLNNNTYYARVISSTQFDLYQTPYDPGLGAVNSPVTSINSYTGGGYAWKNNAFVIDSDFEQYNVDRVYVTVNGYRVPSNNLKINTGNYLSILAPIQPSDVVIITSMMPNSTPNEEVFILNVNKNNEGSVYRANTMTKTWLTRPLSYTDDTIYLKDVTKITDNVSQTINCPSPTDGVYRIGLIGDKNILTQVIVYNNTTGQLVSPTNYKFAIYETAPVILVSDGVSTGDNLTITEILGNLVYINGEQIRFRTVDFVNNALTGLSRGYNGTGTQPFDSEYTEVYGILSTNKLNNLQYYETWNSKVYNPIDGDPLQISITSAAEFLRTDIT